MYITMKADHSKKYTIEKSPQEKKRIQIKAP